VVEWSCRKVRTLLFETSVSLDIDWKVERLERIYKVTDGYNLKKDGTDD
jgi:hypothetical protein